MILQDLDAQLRELAAADQLSGVALISRGDETIFEGAYGWASRTWGVPMRPDIRFDCASITKLFTAVATIQRVDAGDFSLDTSAIDYLGLTGTTISPKVTVRHLLTHTSGIADDADEEDGERYEALWVDRPSYSVREASGHLPNFAHKPPRFAPGEGARYNNAGFVLLGLMIEKATGIGYRDYVREHVFAPAGMTRSGFFAMDEVVPEVAEPCEPVVDSEGRITGWRRNIYSYPPIVTPDGGAHVTAHDLVRFMDALRANKLASPELTAQMCTPQVSHGEFKDGSGRWFGFATQFSLEATGGVRWFGKDGVNVGVSGEVDYYPGHDVTTVVLASSEEGAWDPINRVDAVVRSGALDSL
jgi:CubicO group peptidase (beta-lactamase class C family)